ncbi:MAG: DUF305 domain-containing protein, partial [Pseudomonadota bacterium]|nr:DUF305 domain-containing protein [Pseudomonadota bacterium]
MKRAIFLAAGTAAAAWMSMATAATAQQVPIVQPGAPGAAVRVLSPAQAAQIANTRFSPADIAFMQMMIVHHNQALQMATLAPSRTNNPALLTVAGRITTSQKDEMAFMRDWLAARGAPAQMAAMDHGTMAMPGHAMDHGGPAMKGMATPAEMAALAASSGPAFDRQFLDLMIAHHRGAVDMVHELFELPGSAADPVLYQFATDVDNEQTAEIKRMDTLRASFYSDARVDLKPGFADAGQAILNMAKIASLPRPPGFFDPANPAGLPPPKAKKGAKPGDDPTPGDMKADGVE